MQLRLVRHELRRRLAEGAGVRDQLVLEPSARARRALRRCARGASRSHAPRRASRAHSRRGDLARRHGLPLRVEPLARFGEGRLGRLPLGCRLLGHVARRCESAQPPRRARHRASSSARVSSAPFGRDDLQPPDDALELPLGLLQVLLGRRRPPARACAPRDERARAPRSVCTISARERVERPQVIGDDRVEPIELLQRARAPRACSRASRPPRSRPARLRPGHPHGERPRRAPPSERRVPASRILRAPARSRTTIASPTSARTRASSSGANRSASARPDDERFVRDERPARSGAGHEGRVLRDDRRSALATPRELLEEHDPALDVVNDDVLQPGPEEAGQRVRELRRGLDAIRDEPRDACVARAHDGLRARPDALETRVHLFERAVARSLLRELALALVERPLLELDDLLELGQALLEPASSRPPS